MEPGAVAAPAGLAALSTRPTNETYLIVSIGRVMGWPATSITTSVGVAERRAPST